MCHLEENIAKYQPMYKKKIDLFQKITFRIPMFYLNDTECMYDTAAVFAQKKILYYICVMYCPVISNVSIIILSCPSTHFYLFIDVAFLLYCTCLFYIEQLCFKQPFPAPDLGLGSCPGASTKRASTKAHIVLIWLYRTVYIIMGLLVNVCKFHFNYAFYSEVNG